MKDWLKGLGKAAIDAGKAKLDDTRERLAEPALTAAERLSFDRFRGLNVFTKSQSVREGLPACPDAETKLNRREIRALINHPMFPHVLAAGEKELAEIKAQEEALKAKLAADEAASARNALAFKLARINDFYANELNPIVVRLSQVRSVLPDRDFKALRDSFAEKTGHLAGLKDANSGQTLAMGLVNSGIALKIIGGQMDTAFGQAYYSRTLRDFPPGQRAILRLGEVLNALSKIDDGELVGLKLALVWNEGKTAIQELTTRFDKASEKKAFLEALADLFTSRFGTPEAAAETVQERCRQLIAPSSSAPREIKDELMKHLFSGAQWLTADRARGLAENGETASALRLGQFLDGSGELLYDRDAPVITIAQPGSGKSQAHSLRNLLTLKAPAVVLDVKDRELYDNSAAWRSANVGPVYRFDPQDAAGSIRFNPLDFIDADDTETAYEQAGKVAELLTVPPDKGDYFDERGTQVIKAAVLDVALRETGERRNMQAVLDRVSGVDTTSLDATKDFFQDFVAELEMSDLAPLRRMGKSLHKLVGSDQLKGIMDTAVKALEAWEPPRIARLTASTTFTPELLRDENATLYLCVNQSDVKGYAAVLRVILGLTIMHLCSRKPKPGELTVTFILDEVARLRRMSVIEEASDIGRGYKVRLWLFVQNMGQLSSEYPNADGLLKNCLARCYLSPDEDTAQWLSANLGTRHGLLDGEKHPLVEPHTLTGPEYRDRVIVMLNGFDNARLTKVLADKTPELIERMAMSAVVATAAE